eukprot:2391034-Rhodomonas_salina.2
MPGIHIAYGATRGSAQQRRKGRSPRKGIISHTPPNEKGKRRKKVGKTARSAQNKEHDTSETPPPSNREKQRADAWLPHRTPLLTGRPTPTMSPLPASPCPRTRCNLQSDVALRAQTCCAVPLAQHQTLRVSISATRIYLHHAYL